MIFQDKKILVTGGTGSIGKELVRTILTGERGIPSKVVVLSRDEMKQYHMKRELEEVEYSDRLEFVVGDIRVYSNVCSAVKNVDIIINAAAIKHVPVCEYFPEQAILTNCLGLQNIIRAIDENDYPVSTVVVIGTDKSCEPIGVMGMTKALQERLAIVANIHLPNTRFIGVRYGNVMSALSTGSVIPLFHRLISENKSLTVTDPNMTRFMFGIEQAVQIIFEAISSGLPGDIYVPILKSFKIIDLAYSLIGDKDLNVELIGARPGEKMHELMISDDEAPRTIKMFDYFVICPALPELFRPFGEPVLTGKYSSEDVVVPFAETKQWLDEHGLLLESLK